MYHLATLFVLLGSSLLSFPAPSRAAQPDNCRGDKSAAGYCTPLTFKDTTAGFAAPPVTADCQATCASINADLGDWLVDFSTDGNQSGDARFHDIVLHHCGFAVARGPGTPADARFFLANQDILDLYDETIHRFGGLHQGGISAEGTMRCGELLIKWYIQELYA
ncbi:hypothetical protein F4802DRAFT_419513 [Xylaria palmicola]|nr:hypothetical protein F4802DRAFT_419513 [Xylaria palmicola]